MKEKVPSKCLYLSARLHGITAWMTSLSRSSIFIPVVTQNNKDMISKMSMMVCWPYEFHFKDQVRSNSHAPHFSRLNFIYNIDQLRQKYTELHQLTPCGQSLGHETDHPDKILSQFSLTHEDKSRTHTLKYSK